MFTVTGTLNDGTDYSLRWDAGELVGSGAAYAEVVGLLGQEVGHTPTGPFVTVTEADGASILAALGTVGTITEVRGDAPAVPVAPVPTGATP